MSREEEEQQMPEEGVLPELSMEEIEQYEAGDLPPYWQDTINRLGLRVMRLAMTFGLVVPEYTMRDYVMHAIKQRGGGYETIGLWGTQGSKKSCRSLSISHWAYQDWDVVLKELVMMPDAKDFPNYEERGFLQKLKSIKKTERIPCLIWDDVTVSMPNTTFKTDAEQYGAVDSAWAVIRTKVSVMVLNCPLIDRLGRNVKDNISIEVMIGRNQVEQIERWIRLIGLKKAESNFFKIQMEPLHKFDWKNPDSPAYVPKDIFDQYFNIRLEVAEYAIHKMGVAFQDEATLQEDMMTPLQMLEELPVSAEYLTDKIKRGLIPHETINKRIYVKKADFEHFKRLMLRDKKDLTERRRQMMNEQWGKKSKDA